MEGRGESELEVEDRAREFDALEALESWYYGLDPEMRHETREIVDWIDKVSNLPLLYAVLVEEEQLEPMTIAVVTVGRTVEDAFVRHQKAELGGVRRIISLREDAEFEHVVDHSAVEEVARILERLEWKLEIYVRPVNPSVDLEGFRKRREELVQLVASSQHPLRMWTYWPMVYNTLIPFCEISRRRINQAEEEIRISMTGGGADVS